MLLLFKTLESDRHIFGAVLAIGSHLNRADKHNQLHGNPILIKKAATEIPSRLGECVKDKVG